MCRQTAITKKKLSPSMQRPAKFFGATFPSEPLSKELSHVAAQVAPDPRRLRSCVLLWMSVGPSQTDTFDLKPGHANGGPFAAMQTAASGTRRRCGRAQCRFLLPTCWAYKRQRPHNGLGNSDLTLK